MSDDKYRYFKVTGGAIHAARERFAAKRAAQYDARTALEQEFGAKGIYANEQGVHGLAFPEGAPVPEGWERVKHVDSVWKPNARTKAGRELRKRMASLSVGGAPEFQAEVLGFHDYLHFYGAPGSMFMHFQTHSGVMILIVPRVTPTEEQESGQEIGGGKFSPPDEFCVEIKTSEYWALKENQEAAQA